MKTALVIGPGAIGALLTWHLQSTFRLTVVQHRADKVLPTQLIDHDQTYPLQWAPVSPEAANMAIDLVLVTAKSPMVQIATAPFLHRFRKATWLICCNGMGPQQWLSEQLPGRVLWASTTEGALQSSPHQVQHTGQGETIVGSARPEIADEDSLRLGHWLSDQKGPLTVRWVEDISARLWRKLAINAVINPLTALAGICNGDLLQHRWQSEMTAICCEVTRVAAAEGIVLPADLLDQVRGVAHRTARNRSSMLQDLDHGRLTEIDAINGFLIARGRHQGIATPRLQSWYDAIKKREPACHD